MLKGREVVWFIMGLIGVIAFIYNFFIQDLVISQIDKRVEMVEKREILIHMDTDEYGHVVNAGQDTAAQLRHRR